MSLHFRRPLLRVEKVEGVTVVKISAEDLREDKLQAVGEELFAVADGLAHPQMRLDLGEVRFLTSTGLGKLMALHKRLRAAGGQLVIANVTDIVYEVFEVTCLHQILDVRRESGADPSLPESAPLAS